MIENFISYLAHEPTNTTAPLFLELNTSDMLTVQNTTKVLIYDSNASAGDSPYVKVWDKGQRERTATFLGGSYNEKQWVTCECVALGTTALMAVNRAEYLRLAIEGLVKKLQSNIAGLNTRLDLGGTASTEKVINLQIGSVGQETPVTGANGKFTATRTALIEVWVFKGRKN
ncbi:MAG: hypothetical protein H0X33_13200 [Taibaiella sp.]|nr:hypothetical protein [Taibaiella sp.]